MKSLLDRDFKYRKAVETDIRKTFERVRREQQERARRDADNRREADSKVAARIEPKRRTG